VAAKRLQLTVLTPEGPWLEVPDAEWVQLQLADGGGVGIYPDHAPLLAETQTSALRYAAGGQEQQTAILETGILRVETKRVLLLTSGPADAAGTNSGSASVEGQSFDRLAGALLATLQADASAVWEADDAEADENAP